MSSNSVPTGKSCRVCKTGMVMKETRSVYDPATGPPIIGPGSRHQTKQETSYHCGSCGVMYAFPPKQ